MGLSISAQNRFTKLSVTTTPLNANASYISNLSHNNAFKKIMGHVYASHAGTLYIQQSGDGAHWDVETSFAIAAGAGKGFSVDFIAKYLQIKYTNGGTNQTAFRLTVNLR